MKFSTSRKISRVVHLVFGLFLGTYFYSPLAQDPTLFTIIQVGIIPIITFTGIWMWKGYLIKK
ncbi:MAG: hypothetical protein ACRCVT_12120 [Leadbetterella sp.]